MLMIHFDIDENPHLLYAFRTVFFTLYCSQIHSAFLSTLHARKHRKQACRRGNPLLSSSSIPLSPLLILPILPILPINPNPTSRMNKANRPDQTIPARPKHRRRPFSFTYLYTIIASRQYIAEKKKGMRLCRLLGAGRVRRQNVSSLFPLNSKNDVVIRKDDGDADSQLLLSIGLFLYPSLFYYIYLEYSKGREDQ